MIPVGRRLIHVTPLVSRGMATLAKTRHIPKDEGSIAAIFTSLTPGEEREALPERFAALKRDIFKDALVETWRQVIKELEGAVSVITEKGNELITRIPYTDLMSGNVSQQQIDNIRKVGTVIVTGAVKTEEALAWKQHIKDYAAANVGRIKGFPEDNIQVFEIYNSIAQTRARTHPGIINTQKFLLSLWHTTKPGQVRLDIPISYYDRLRIRQPGDAKFTLGPHIDGGSVERWEDLRYRSVYGKLFEGGDGWKDHDPFNASSRVGIKSDMYHTPNACSIFRPWQGWTSLSRTGPNEGTLRVLPMLPLASAYIMLRPFFRPKDPGHDSLKFEDWELDLNSSEFPGSSIRKTQELNDKTHPHLKLSKTMVSIPPVEPGDQVYWHCDVVHAVEAHHNGLGDSSVLYIPAVPLTLHNAHYLRDQRNNFVAGLPPPDFPGGEGESKCVGRGAVDHVSSQEGRQLLGFEKFGIPSALSEEEKDFLRNVNHVLEF